MEEMRVESQSQPSDDPDRLAFVLVTGPPSKKPRSVRNLRSGLLGRLQERQQEIEVSCSSAHDTHPEGGEVEMVTETPAVPVVVPAEVAPGEVHPTVNVEVAPGDVHPAGNAEVPNPEQESSSLASSEGNPVNDAWVSGLRGMANQYDLFTDLLRTTDYVKAFATRRKDAERSVASETGGG
ncbi:hypothetical protein CK203_048913 [Vitis vinifera]|uniref:Uncharacterized protein n=1 Tax=Vitis vinifera TaxID=29760 RepID=A0A438GVH7_VITVI|nr:hypothetical protein CK203_048913 [Vitis vinifera]